MSTATRSRRRLARRARTLTSLYALGTATALILVALDSGHRPALLESLFGLLNLPVSPSLLSLVVLALTTRALLARKRAGLVLAGLFQLAGAIVGVSALFPSGNLWWLELWQSRGDFGRVMDVASVFIALLMLWWLGSVRDAFPGRLHPRRIGVALLAFAAGVAATGLATVAMVDATAPGGADARTVTEAVLAAFGGLTRPYQVAVPAWVVHTTATLIALTVLACVVVLLYPARGSSRWSGEAEVRIRELLHRHGAGDSLGYFATRRDKEATFAVDGLAAVTHRAVLGVSLASADPVGDRAAWPAAITRWLAEARAEGLIPAVLSASEDGARAYAAAGLRVGRMGDEAVLRVRDWDLGRPAMASVARAVRHARRTGLTVACLRQEDLTAEQRDEVTTSAEAWRGTEADHGFSMALNRSGDAADGRILHVLARGTNGHLVGVLSFVPWGQAGASLDVMRRAPEAPGGTMELMIAELMSSSRALGLRQVSLNFCMFSDVFQGADSVAANGLVRFGAAVLGRLDRYWQLERLYRFSQRFEPEWQPRLYCYDDPATLGEVALAAAVAEGFLALPGRGDRASGQLTEAQLDRIRALDVPSDVPDVVRSQHERHRLARRESLLAAGIDPNPPGGHEPSGRLADLVRDDLTGQWLDVVGRVLTLRDHGGVVFVTLVDGAAQGQAVIDAAHVGSEGLELLRRTIDLGDLVRISGTLGASRNGTPSLLADEWRMEAKAVRPVPFSGLDKPLARSRDRAADLLVHPAELDVLRARSRAVEAVRRVLASEGYLEVDTPVLQAVHGGATARPFETWSNALGMPLSLRIAPELYLKRLLVAGIGPVFEIARNFRNEGVDGTHNPEFTSLEAYRPHADYTTMRHLTERLVREAAIAVHGAPVMPIPDTAHKRTGLTGIPMTDVSSPWRVVRVLDAVSAALGVEVTMTMTSAALSRAAATKGIRLSPTMSVGAMVEDLYGRLVEPATVEPTFYVDFPRDTSPLTRPHRTDAGLVERWDLVVNGMELATAYSELTDPLDQRQRLTEQSRLAAAGDPEAMQLDEDFLRALELGMPPAGGLGIGLDRLVMALLNVPIRSVLAFPLVRPSDARREVPDPMDEVA